jgi:superfamily II DNA or RNA helicase
MAKQSEALRLDGIRLWKHQRTAVETCEKYLRSRSTGAALVHHPTGTGKTGIIATVATKNSHSKPALVICPSEALLGQLNRDIASTFWKRISAPARWAPEHVPALLPSKVDALIADLDRQKDRIVVVSTIQALQQIHSLQYSDYNKLVGRFNVVIFDEGHREPAPSWAAAARGLLARTILMSATPFRNDLKLFEVDLDHVDFLSFEGAVRKQIIRDVEISEEVLSFDAGAFASRCIALRDQLIQSGRFEPTSKMIVRAASEHTVQSLYDAFCVRLRARNDGVIAIHDRFADEGNPGAQKLSEVPSNLRDRTERFLIHQYKLTEGIDDRSCAMLAIFENFSNERQLVQQIGRVTRNPAKIGERCPPAYVLARIDDGVSNMFERFRRFDQACIDAGGKPPLRNDSAIVSEILKAMPNVDYIGENFELVRISMTTK